MAEKRLKHGVLAEALCDVGSHSTLYRLTLHVVFSISPCFVGRTRMRKSVQKRAKSPRFARCGWQSDTFRETAIPKLFSLIVWSLTRCETAFDLSPSFCFDAEKCGRRQKKRFWSECWKVECKQKPHICLHFVIVLFSLQSPMCLCA